VTARLLPTARAALASIACAAAVACGGGGGNGDGGGGGPLNITTTTADDGAIGVAYAKTIVSTGGQGAKSFSISAGALPAGLTISATGAISGTPAGPVGTSSFTVSVTDSAATPATDMQALSIDIVEPLQITTASLADTSVGEDYDANVVATGGAEPYTFGVSSGALPNGISLAATGSLAGTVAASATTETFSVQVDDSSSPAFSETREYTVRVALEPRTTALADALSGVPYSDALEARGGLPPLTWEILSGSLPSGLAMTPDGVVSGTPDPICGQASTLIQAQVTDSDVPPQSAVRAGIDLTLTQVSLSIANQVPPNGRVNVPYSHQFVATGGMPPYSFAVSIGSLPSGLSLDANTGLISGIPDTVETRGFQITVTDGCTAMLTQGYGITIDGASPGRNDSIATATTLPGNGSYSASISPSGDPSTVFAPDEDYYRIVTTATSTITIDINADVNGSPVDTVIEVVNAGGSVLNQCVAPGYNSPCVSDDEVLGVDLDSFLRLRVTGPTTVYIHVVEWGGNARPDMLYDLVLSGIN
jgi:hypothetical protein